jgi:hypothetical protein
LCPETSTENAVKELGCGVAQLVVRRLAVRQARVPFSARHPMEVLLLLSEEAMRIQEDKKTGLGEWLRMKKYMIVLCE